MSTQAARVAVIGAGWAGLAAAVELCAAGRQVLLLDMAHQPGGRARSLAQGDLLLDNGQHILIGAYRDTLALMRRVGASPEHLLHRSSLTLRYPDGSGLVLPSGPALLSFARGVLGWHTLPWRDRVALLLQASRWGLQGFRCDPSLTVQALCRGLPASVMQALIEPLCVAALNTPADQASAQVLLTVLKDALFGPRGSADLLLPTAPLQALLPDPALAWLQQRGTEWRPGARVQQLHRLAEGWQVRTDEGQDDVQGVVLACSANEAGRLLAPHAPDWAETAQALRYEPIVTVWLRNPAHRAWPEPMLALQADAQAPAQFGFDLGALGGPANTLALVISGAAPWVAQGLPTTVAAVRRQLAQAFAGRSEFDWDDAQVELVAVRAEKRATFACTPALQRPSADPLPGLRVAGDHVAGPYPATLEGAVRSGLAAARALITS